MEHDPQRLQKLLCLPVADLVSNRLAECFFRDFGFPARLRLLCRDQQALKRFIAAVRANLVNGERRRDDLVSDQPVKGRWRGCEQQHIADRLIGNVEALADCGI